MPEKILEYSFGLQAFLQHFLNPAPHHTGNDTNHSPAANVNSSPWMRTLLWADCAGHKQCMKLICCPEDAQCPHRQHSLEELCAKCRVPLCNNCTVLFRKNSTLQQRVPRMALANDNFVGFLSDFWRNHKPRWIEMAAATPVWTSLMAFYVEGDKGHLMNQQVVYVHIIRDFIAVVRLSLIIFCLM